MGIASIARREVGRVKTRIPARHLRSECLSSVLRPAQNLHFAQTVAAAEARGDERAPAPLAFSQFARSSSARRMTRSITSCEVCLAFSASIESPVGGISSVSNFSKTGFMARAGLRRNSELEIRLRALFFLFQRAHEARGVFRMLNQLPAKVVRFQVVVGTERMNDPHLVAGAAGGDIKTLFEEFLIPQREGTALGGVHQGDE